MIKVKQIVSSNKLIGLEIKGHAGFDEIGKDLVCAGVSSIVTGGFNALIKDEIEEIILDEGYAKVVLKKDAIDSKIVLKTILIQLQTIEESYPKNIKLSK